MKRTSGSWKAVRRALLTAMLLPLGFLGWRLATDNFATVANGHIYRSAQMRPDTIRRVIREKGIKTVLNLRGAPSEQAWYREERSAVLAAGATQVDVPMSSCEWMSRAQMQTLVHMLDTSEYPLLIHCQHGAERTGLVSAFTELLRPGGSLQRARAQLSVFYLFLPVKDGAVMLEHLNRYEQWLKQNGSAHSPRQFRAWVADGFRPGHPSREDWPYDPYPLVIVTRPEPQSASRDGARDGESRK